MFYIGDNMTNERLYVRYYKADGTYLDHGRLIGIGGVPKIERKISPFMGNNGPIVWEVVDVKSPVDAPCLEVYVND
jgi:hypothetical protein